MGRKSKLSEEQWADIGRRLLEGGIPRTIAREFTASGTDLNESTIRSHFERRGQKVKTIQQVATQVYDAERATKAAEQAVQALPPEVKYTVMTMVDRMRSIGESLAEVADNSAKTSVHFSAMALDQAKKIDRADPSKSVDHIKNSVLLTKAANEAAHVPLSFVSAVSRDAGKRFGEGEEEKPDTELTPERLTEGARRIAFVLARAAVTPQQEPTHG